MAQLDWSIDFEQGELTDAVLKVFDFDRKYDEQDKFEGYFDRKLKRLYDENEIQFGSRDPEARKKMETLSKRAEVYALKVVVGEAYGSDEAFYKSVVDMLASGGNYVSDEQIVLLDALTKPFADEYEKEKVSKEGERLAIGQATDRFDTGSWKDLYY